MLDHPDREPERVIDRSHPLGVAARQVVVDRDDVDPPPRQGVEVGRERGDQGLPLAGGHLGDLPLVEDDATHELDVEVAHPHRAPGRLPADGERLRQQIVQLGAVGQALLEFLGPGPEGGVGEGLEAGFEGADGLDRRRHPLDVALVLRAEDRLEECGKHVKIVHQRSASGGQLSAKENPRRGNVGG